MNDLHLYETKIYIKTIINKFQEIIVTKHKMTINLYGGG